MNDSPDPLTSSLVPAHLLPLEKRDTWIRIWLLAGKRPASGFGLPMLPGTRNTLDDLAQGYASHLNDRDGTAIPACEVDPLYTDDSAYMNWVSLAFWLTIARHFGMWCLGG